MICVKPEITVLNVRTFTFQKRVLICSTDITEFNADIRLDYNAKSHVPITLKSPSPQKPPTALSPGPRDLHGLSLLPLAVSYTPK